MRKAMGLTLRDVSKATGISLASVNRAERGRETTLSNAKKIAAFFGQPVDDIWISRQKKPRRS
jgi:transcriptional regulator with XRE-family HTH domain